MIIWFIVVFLESTQKGEIQLVQYCAAISAIVQLLFSGINWVGVTRTKQLVIEQLLYPALKSAVSAPRRIF